MRTANPRLGYVLVLLGVVGFSLNSVVARLILNSGVNAWTLAEVRAIGGAVALLGIVVITGRAGKLRMPRATWPRLIIYGVFGLGLLQVLYFEAIARIPIGLALLIEYLAPVWVALWAKFIQKQAVSRLLWPALAITVTGLAIVAGAGLSGLDPVGVLAAFLAGLCFAIYFIAGERLVGQSDPFVVSFWGFAIAGVIWAVIAFTLPSVTPAMSIDYSVQADLPAALGAGTIAVGLLFLWVVLLGTVMPFAAETSAMQWVPATTVSVIAMLEPIVATVFAWWWFDEQLRAVQMLGGLLVLTGVILAMLSRSSHPTLVPPD